MLGRRILGGFAAVLKRARSRPGAVGGVSDLRCPGAAGILVRLVRDAVINGRAFLGGSLLLADGALADALLALGTAVPADPSDTRAWRALQPRRLSAIEAWRKRRDERQVMSGSRLWS